MKRWHVLVLLAVFLFGGSLVWGFDQLSNSIYHHTDCERFNIDHIELRTGINIPAVTSSVCDFDAVQNRKVSSFTLAEIAIDEYAARNHFEQVAGKYTRSGSGPAHQWEAELDPETNILTVKIAYGR